MRRRRPFRWCLLGLLVLAGGLTLTGCKTADDQNDASIPWNSPKSWEGGFPSGMMEQHR